MGGISAGFFLSGVHSLYKASQESGHLVDIDLSLFREATRSSNRGRNEPTGLLKLLVQLSYPSKPAPSMPDVNEYIAKHERERNAWLRISTIRFGLSVLSAYLAYKG